MTDGKNRRWKKQPKEKTADGKNSMSTLIENVIHFAIRCHQENILVLQLSLAELFTSSEM